MRVEHIGDCTLYQGDCLEVMAGMRGLQAMLHEALVEMPKARRTPSQEGEIAGTDLDV